jgi:transcriptional regulator with XRE-family HTH domain
MRSRTRRSLCRPLDGKTDKRNNASMSKSKPQPTLTDVLRAAMEQSGLTVYRIGKATRIDAANLRRFARGEMSIRLDKADRLAAYLGLRLTPDPDAVPPEPTPENLARPTLAKRTRKRATYRKELP